MVTISQPLAIATLSQYWWWCIQKPRRKAVSLRILSSAEALPIGRLNLRARRLILGLKRSISAGIGDGWPDRRELDASRLSTSRSRARTSAACLASSEDQSSRWVL